MSPLTLLIVGAGNRGQTFANHALDMQGRAKVVGVAEPQEARRRRLAEQWGIAPENIFADWKEAARRDRLADAAIITTQDAMHAEPAVALADRGYHILLEKPMAPNEADCRRVAEAARRNAIILAVGHVLRYTVYTRKLKSLIDSGAIGDVVSLQHLEPVGYWHQAHSYVRGNWRNEAGSSFMLMTKSCHDLDWIRYIIGVPCRKIASFGSLFHFRKVNQPTGAADRCLDCPVEPNCPYSAKRIYLGRFHRGQRDWPLDVLTDDVTLESLTEALRTGPYGRCVYTCDNDVVDNQVVTMEFEGGRTATFTMTAFDGQTDRRTRIFGTLGRLSGDGRHIEHLDFLTDHTEVLDTQVAADGGIPTGHGGGDGGLFEAFVTAVADGDPSKVLSGPAESLKSHLMLFAAERARRENRVVEL